MDRDGRGDRTCRCSPRSATSSPPSGRSPGGGSGCACTSSRRPPCSSRCCSPAAASWRSPAARPRPTTAGRVPRLARRGQRLGRERGRPGGARRAHRTDPGLAARPVARQRRRPDRGHRRAGAGGDGGDRGNDVRCEPAQVGALGARAVPRRRDRRLAAQAADREHLRRRADRGRGLHAGHEPAGRGDQVLRGRLRSVRTRRGARPARRRRLGDRGRARSGARRSRPRSTGCASSTCRARCRSPTW